MNAQCTLSSKVATDGTAEVLVRFYAGRFCDQQAHTAIRVPVASWRDGALIIPKRNATPDTQHLIRLQRELDNMKSYIYDAYTRACGHVQTGWLRNTIKQFHGIRTTQAKHLISDFLLDYAEQNNLAPHTRSLYALVALRWKRVQPLLTIEATTTEDLREMERWMREKGLAHNTIHLQMRHTHTALRYAAKQGLIDFDPFDKYKMPAERYGAVTYLTAEERDMLTDAPMPTRYVAQQRDIFIFQCHTGMRIGDLMALKQWNITADGYLQYIQQKTLRSTQKVVRVPLSPVALNILKRYANNAQLLPFKSLFYYNSTIRNAMRFAGITREVIVPNKHTGEQQAVRLCDIASSHMARRTFAALAFIATGSERIVASMTGHAPRSVAMLRYTEVTDSMKRSALGIESPDKNPTL